MSTETSTTKKSDDLEHEEHTHGGTDKQYFQIFWVLVVLTALEVSTEWWDEWFGEDSRPFAVFVLIATMVVKFVLVALFFMHLKWDTPILKRIFYFGVVVAMAVYIITMTSMNFWTNSGTDEFNDPPPAPPPVEASD